MTSRHAVRLLDWPDARADAMRIREQVFVHEQGVPIEIEMDEHDAVSQHALASTAAGDIVATGRLLPDGHIGRMAVLRPWRGQGAGAAILAALIECARRRGLAQVVLSAQTHAAGFYRRFGFVAEGEPYLEVEIPHVKMVLSLAARDPG